MSKKIYDILYSGYNRYTPQDMTEIIDLQLEDERRAMNLKRMQTNIESLSRLDAEMEQNVAAQQANLLDQTQELLLCICPLKFLHTNVCRNQWNPIKLKSVSKLRITLNQTFK